MLNSKQLAVKLGWKYWYLESWRKFKMNNGPKETWFWIGFMEFLVSWICLGLNSFAKGCKIFLCKYFCAKIIIQNTILISVSVCPSNAWFHSSLCQNCKCIDQDHKYSLIKILISVSYVIFFVSYSNPSGELPLQSWSG